MCGDKYEIIKRMSECKKFSLKEYKNMHDWMEKAIYLELCKRRHFVYAFYTDSNLCRREWSL